MFQITAAEMVSKVQAEMAREAREAREAFYADDEIWKHEFCGPECVGDHD